MTPRRCARASPVQRLLAVARRFDRFLILAHDNPDPDCLASALALQALLEREAGIRAPIAYGGIIGRPENVAMVGELGIELVPLEAISLRTFDGIGLVDSQPGHGNNALPARRRPAVVVDHHSPVDPRSERALFCDVRSELGATSTILTGYLFEVWDTIPARLATALFYGIKSDTLDLGRETTPVDVEAYRRLFLLADQECLARIQTPPLPRTYFQDLRTALSRAFVHEHVVFTSVGETPNPDMVPEVADLLLRLEGAHWAIAVGVYESTLYLSVRTNDPSGRANTLIRRVVGRRGSAGGHNMLAGGRIPIAGSPRLLEERVRRRFLKLLGVSVGAGGPLLEE